MVSKAKFAPHGIKEIASCVTPKVLNRKIIDEIILVKGRKIYVNLLVL